MTRVEAFEYARRIRNKTKGASIIVLDGECIDAILSNPWHKVSEELPKEIKYAENTLQGRREWTESKIVLTIDNHYLPNVDCLKNGEWMKLRTHPRDCDGFPINYLYWMEIPELPKEIVK